MSFEKEEIPTDLINIPVYFRSFDPNNNQIPNKAYLRVSMTDN
jgi:hypothetical protein